MQTIFRLPWSTEPSSDEALADKMYLHKPRPKQPRVDISMLNTNASGTGATGSVKRKRVDGGDAHHPTTPKHQHAPPQVKKLKSERGDGAVQAPSVLPKGVDAVVSSHPPTPTISMADIRPYSPSPAPAAAAGFAKEKELPAGVTPVSSVAPSLAPSAAPSPVSSAPAVNDDVKTEPAATSATDPFAVTQMKVDLDSNLDKLRAIIEAHINLEILHKHNELRLIEQELAKCQISLEQLRRCELMPYPGFSGPSQTVTQGTGKSLKAPAGYTEPQYPAPWGVTDGPYARHYATWLLPDPAFDPWRVHGGSHVGTPMTTRGNRAMHRGNAFDFHLPVQAARTSRTSTGNRQEHGNSSGRDPMIMKRQADNEWVRLRCSVCHRSNFNNIQGFLNHCRIAHHQDYKSHEAAAIACGEIVQVDEATMTATEPASKDQHPPAPSRVNSMPLPTPASRAERVDSFPLSTPVDQPHVNPLVLQQPSTKNPIERIIDLSSTGSPKPSATPRPAKNSRKGTLAPHLSSLMQRRGMSTSDLPAFIVDAKKKVDLSVYDVSDSDHDVEVKARKHKQKKPPKSTSTSHQNLQRSQSTPNVSSSRQPSAKKAAGRQMPTFSVNPTPSPQPHPIVHSHPPPITGVGFHPSVFQHVPETPSDGDVEMELSPGTAPGLVSDHEEDEFDEDEAGSANGSHTSGFMGLNLGLEDVEIRDGSDVERDERKSRETCGGNAALLDFVER
ncbi:uncharacterized protein PV09_03897 [Verruconis gallopava]|uniref:AHC1-like C2H2 zinc-finger domain-containing protein n=1 Tax=Verruconis gallopava TaxID=253628 RepID=A0A0D1YXF2_9PEZI|nr:uncharacterized protein PV09_03897 [Verruconis gallopava]KIW05382.1 hypothetical protein PV09_03897 [Verruconis gallopava]